MCSKALADFGYVTFFPYTRPFCVCTRKQKVHTVDDILLKPLSWHSHTPGYRVTDVATLVDSDLPDDATLVNKVPPQSFVSFPNFRCLFFLSAQGQGLYVNLRETSLKNIPAL